MPSNQLEIKSMSDAMTYLATTEGRIDFEKETNANVICVSVSASGFFEKRPIASRMIGQYSDAISDVVVDCVRRLKAKVEEQTGK